MSVDINAIEARGRVLFVDREGALSIWNLLQPVAVALEKVGWDTGFVTMADDSGRPFPSTGSSLGVRTIPVPSKRWAGDLLRQQWAFKKGFSAVLREWCPDVVHVNFAIPGIWARRVAKRMGVPLVISTQHELRGSMSWHLRLGLCATRGCVDVHTYVSEAVAASFGVADQVRAVAACDGLPRHTVIRNGVDEAAIAAVADNPAGRVPGRVVAPGRLVPVKEHRRILTAFARVRRHQPGAELLIAGSGPEESSLRRLAARLEIADVVKFTGWLPREELWSLVASAQVAVFASDGTQEGFGLSLAEAALLGTPLVASRITAFREVLAEDDQAAWWFQPSDVDDLADALGQAMTASAEARQHHVKTARQIARSRATQSMMLKQYTQLYSHLVPERERL